MINKVKKGRRQIVLVVSGLAMITSIVVIIGWVFNISSVLNIVVGGPTMKFNTALCFFLSALGITLAFSRKIHFKSISRLLGFLVLFIGSFSLGEYLFSVPSFLDNFFVNDLLSGDYPGRMSAGTAFCFSMLGLCLIAIQTEQLIILKTVQHVLMLVLVIAFVSLITFILEVPTANKVFFINTMAVHTSMLFILLAASLSFKNIHLGFTALIFEDYDGSKLIRKLIPFIVLLSISLTYILLIVINSNIINYDFGLVFSTVVFILISVLYISVIGIDLNKKDIKWIELQKSLRDTNQELEYYKQALDKSSIVAFTDEKGIITDVNEKFCEISKYNRDEIIGNTHKLINSKHHNRDFFKKLWGTIRTGEVWIGDIKNKAKDGSYYWVHTSIVPFKSEAGNIYRYLAIRQDITKRKEAEEMLASQYVKKLEQKNTELEQFAYIASHDLQEPLRSVTNFVNILVEDYNDKFDADGSKYLRIIGDATERMRNLIKFLLDYSRLGRERKLSLVDCKKLTEDAVSDLSESINTNNTVIEIGEMPKLYAYETEMRQLFQNLISNAIKFQKKEITPHIKINALRENGSWKFTIADNGIGISSVHFTRIFQIFQRLHTSREYQGYGIGLPNCKKIVELHEGEIWVESEVGEGSTFNFTIPKLKL
ncbi:sensor histidine kinase [Chondrinema litorale]|uniref:sensor histidine kinase n=1 Tax=Chondrinema litorale TaxID=2994555 RepID=UPI002542A975|nr:ATP-binding protein [Chondrinema litorale]UZR99465.1 ATP-binding protein [Chondrinema litorale]